MQPKRLLIFPAGSEIAFEILNALKFSKFVEVYGGTSVDDHSEYVYKRLIKGFPYVGEPNFLEYLNHVIKEYGIDCVYPAHDSAGVYLCENADKVNAQVIITDPETTAICRSKKETYAKKIDNLHDLVQSIEEDPSLVICEYLPGMEYTVDCFTDRKGNLLVTKIRDRERIRAGISVRSKLKDTDDEVRSIAETINRKLHFRGAWFFQLKRNTSGEYRLLEISPRIPGTMGLSRNCGINFPMLTLFDFWGYDISVIDNGYPIILDRAFYSAYHIDIRYDHVYVDFDDTLIVNSEVNIVLLSFLYQAVQQGKKLHLLSKHTNDIYADMKSYKISAELFDEIIVIPQDDEKYHYIKESSAIFIDDSFAERKKIHDELGLYVFDVDMVEGLLDWRY